MGVTAGRQTEKLRNNYFQQTRRKMSQGKRQHHVMMMDTPPPPPTAPAPAQQQDMTPPPSYGEAVSGPVPLPGPMVAAPVIQKPFAGLPGIEFGSEPVQLSCWSCHRQIVTDVTSEITSSGCCFAFMCCIFGSWLAALLPPRLQEVHPPLSPLQNPDWRGRTQTRRKTHRSHHLRHCRGPWHHWFLGRNKSDYSILIN